jgi:hypothetical protein
MKHFKLAESEEFCISYQLNTRISKGLCFSLVNNVTRYLPLIRESINGTEPIRREKRIKWIGKLSVNIPNLLSKKDIIRIILSFKIKKLHSISTLNLKFIENDDHDSSHQILRIRGISQFKCFKNIQMFNVVMPRNTRVEEKSVQLILNSAMKANNRPISLRIRNFIGNNLQIKKIQRLKQMKINFLAIGFRTFYGASLDDIRRALNSRKFLGSAEIANYFVDSFSRSIAGINSLLALSLNFHGSKVSDFGLRSLVYNGLMFLKQLESLSLDFNFCKSITDDGFRLLIDKGLVNLPQLKTLIMRMCGTRVSDAGVNYLTDCFKHISNSLENIYLELIVCPVISKKTISLLIDKGIRSLVSPKNVMIEFGGIITITCVELEKGKDDKHEIIWSGDYSMLGKRKKFIIKDI